MQSLDKRVAELIINQVANKAPREVGAVTCTNILEYISGNKDGDILNVGNEITGKYDDLRKYLSEIYNSKKSYSSFYKIDIETGSCINWELVCNMLKDYYGHSNVLTINQGPSFIIIDVLCTSKL